MNDREMLEFAAKAAGIGYTISPNGNLLAHSHPNGGWMVVWNPITDDGDALRLAVKLNMTCRFYFGNSVAQATVPGGPSVYEVVTDTIDPNDGARLAIVRVAAEIGKAMP